MSTLCQRRRTKVDDVVSTSTKPPPALPLEVADRVVCGVPVHVGEPAVPMALRFVKQVPHDVMHIKSNAIYRDT